MPPRQPSVDDSDALGARPDASSVRRSQAQRIPGPARVPAEALSLADLRSGAEQVSGDERGARGAEARASTPSHEALGESTAARDARVRTSSSSLPPRIAHFAHFEVLGRIAVGGMAEIYLGRDSVEGGALRQLAIKVLRRPVGTQDEAYFEELFLREGRTAAQLVHPNICHIYSFGKWRGHLYIAMEWIDGVSLSQVLRSLAERRRTLDPLIAASIAAQVAGALDYAHHARDARRRALAIVHRDVNPQNIMIRHDGMVKLLDFGVAQVADRHTDSRSNTVKGKFGYMAPEQAQQKSIDGRADVFALGVCLYEMLTGARLYKRGSLRETVEALLSEPAPPLSASEPTLPAELDAIVQRALAKDPNDRFASAADMQAALETFLARSGEVVSARRISSMMDTIYPEARVASPSLFTGPEVAERLAALEEEAEPQGVGPSGSPIGLPLQYVGSLRLVVGCAVGLLLCALLWSWAAREPTRLGTHEPPRASTSAQAAARAAQPAAAGAAQQAPRAEPDADATPTTSPAAAPAAKARAASPEKRGSPAARRRRRSPDFVVTPGF